MRDELRDILGVDEDDMPNTRTDRYLNLSWWEIADKYDFLEKERESSISTVASTRDYAAPASIEAIQRLYITPTEDGVDPVKLHLMDKDVYAEKYINNTNQEGQPSHYLSFDNDTIRLWPTPDDVYAITVHYLVTLADIASGGPEIPQSWHEIILQGAVWRGYRWLKDSQKMIEAKNIQTELMNGAVVRKAEEKKDSRYAALSVPMKRGY